MATRRGTKKLKARAASSGVYRAKKDGIVAHRYASKGFGVTRPRSKDS